MLINEIKPILKQKKSKRVGRGSSSGHGKTSCRGHKGANARSGRRTYRGFIGGQMRLVRRLPKIGFNAYKVSDCQIINLEDILKGIKKDIQEINPEVLEQFGLIGSKEKAVKILGTGEINRPLSFSGCLFSANAAKKIQSAGGKIVTLTKIV
ncbi:MAG: 50S ribosomal protein L15 [Candidatus Omnitrophota bacterium]